MVRVALICSGNICRSFMAERVFTKRIPGAEFVSAGIAPPQLNGPAAPHAVKVLDDAGYDSGGHRSRALSDRVLKADLILVAAQDQISVFTRLGRAAQREVRALSEFDPRSRGEDIADPWGSDIDQFRRTLTLIERCVPELGELLSRRH